MILQPSGEIFAFCKKKGYFYAQMSEEGLFSKYKNADMSSFVALSEGAGWLIHTVKLTTVH